MERGTPMMTNEREVDPGPLPVFERSDFSLVIEAARHHGRKILLLIGLCLAAAGAVLFVIPAKFESTASLIVAPREQQVIQVDQVVQPLRVTPDAVDTEMAVLKSRGLAHAVITNLGLDKLPEFNPALRPRGPLKKAAGEVKAQVMAWLQLSPESAGNPESQIVDTFLRRLTVRQVGKSRVIELRFLTEDPTLAAKIPNTLTDLYLARQLADKESQTREANTWLSPQVVELREAARRSWRAVEDFRIKSGLLQGRDADLVREQISSVSEDLLRARAARVMAEGRLAQATNAPLSALQREVAEARLNEQALDSHLARLRQQAEAIDRATVQLQGLEREAESNQKLYETFLSRYKETGIMPPPVLADASVEARADIPTKPVSPNVPLVLALTLALSGTFGLILAFAAEQFDDSVRSGVQIEQETQARAVGFIPMIKGFLPVRVGIHPEAHVVKYPRSPFSEALYATYCRLMTTAGSGRGEPATLLVTSALPVEGKSTVSLALARLLASHGTRVLVIDGDCRRPSIHRMLGQWLGRGLADWLADEAAFDDVVRQDEASAAHFLSAGTRSRTGPPGLDVETLRHKLQDLAGRYDLVIIDTAPMSVAVDAALLASWVDRTLFLARWGKTRRQTVALMLRDLAAAQGRRPLVAISMVDVRKYATYSFGDSGQYYGKAGGGYFTSS
jgi:polysaccharide biosynthesis transport protein